jgi:hypothetical protein
MGRCSTVVDASTGGCHIDHPSGRTTRVDVLLAPLMAYLRECEDYSLSKVWGTVSRMLKTAGIESYL